MVMCGICRGMMAVRLHHLCGKEGEHSRPSADITHNFPLEVEGVKLSRGGLQGQQQEDHMAPTSIQHACLTKTTNQATSTLDWQRRAPPANGRAGNFRGRAVATHKHGPLIRRRARVVLQWRVVMHPV